MENSDHPQLETEPIDDTQQTDGTTSIRLGRAILQPMEEKNHYGLYRPVVIVRRDGEKITRERLQDPVGPLAIYRLKRNGDKDPPNVGSLPGVLSTTDPKTKEPMKVILIWRPDTGKTE